MGKLDEKLLKQINKIIWMVLVILVIVTIGFIMWNHKGSQKDTFSIDDNNISEWNSSWDVRYDGTMKQDVSLPAELPLAPGKTVMIRKRLPDKIKMYNCLMIESKRQDIVVSIGGIQRASYTDKGQRLCGKTTPSGYVLVPLYNTDSWQDVLIQFTSDSSYSGKISSVYLGNEKSLTVMILKANMLWVFLIAIVFIMSVFCAISYFMFASNFKIGKAVKYLALFAFFSSVWSFSQSGMRQFFVADLTGLEAIGYCGYMLLPIPILLYVNWVTEERNKKLLIGYVHVVLVNIVAEIALFCIFKVGFFEMRYVSKFIFLLAILLMVVVAIVDKKNISASLINSLLIGAAGLLIGLSTEVFFQSVHFIGEATNRYVGGAFIFVLSAFLYTSTVISKEQKQRKDEESANIAKMQFLSSMSHEIKTPINAMLGMNEMILRDTGEDNIREYAANISAAGSSLLSLVNDILDFSKIESGEMEIICADYQMKKIFQDLILMAETKAKEKGLKIILDIDESIPTICNGDCYRIKQAVANLLTNAIKYTEEGSVTFSVKNLGIRDDQIDLYFGVKDTGVGIKQRDIERFMESFVRIEQVKNSNVAGTGLGLSITTRILQLMGTKLEVESVYGEGSNFHFTVSQKIIDKTSMGSVKVKAEVQETKRKINFVAPEARILGVDDNRINLKVLSGILRVTKIRVDTCESGQDCLELCKQNHYDLIFMDHMMPEMDGIETFQKIRADKSLKSTDSPVVVLTANTVSGAGEMYKECGFDYYMKKPIDVAELNTVMQQYIAKEMIRPLEVG